MVCVEEIGLVSRWRGRGEERKEKKGKKKE
jgi:hypothetical protein